MSDADIILIFIGIISLLIAFGQLIVAFLAFLTRDKGSQEKNKPIPSANRIGNVRKDK